MILNRFSARNWRAHSQISIEFHPLSNLLCGKNDAGKTSVLKGIVCCLTPGGRIGSTDDIRHGADEATLELELSVPSESGFQRHTISRRFTTKGKSFFEIDGEKVSVSRAIEILTLEWGLPHPEQLAGLVWLRQLRIDSLIREDAATRQERFRALLGFQLLKGFAAPLEKVIAQYNATATAERSLGVDSRELATELAATRTQIEAYERELAELLNPTEAAELDAALKAAMLGLDYSHREKIANDAVESLPTALLPWVTVGNTLPSLDRLSDLAKSEKQLETACISLASMGDEERESSQLSDLKRWVLEQRRQTLTRAVADALSELPLELHAWIDARKADRSGKWHGDVPAIARIDDLATQLREIGSIDAKLSSIPAPDALQSESHALRQWLLRNTVESADAALKACHARLPDGLKTWADSVTAALASTRHLPKEQRVRQHREAGVVSAAAVIERNRQALQSAAHNKRLKSLKSALSEYLPEGSPDASKRAFCSQAISAEAELSSFAERLKLGNSATNGDGFKLRAFAQIVERASLLDAVPSDGLSESESNWSHEVEQALRTIWNEMGRTHRVTGECPLTCDVYSEAQVMAAQAAQQKRQAAREASAQWQTFVQKVRTKDQELAAMLDKGEFAKAVEAIRAAAADKAALILSVAPSDSPYWTSPAQRKEFGDLYTVAEGYRSSSDRQVLAWVEAEATKRKITSLGFLSEIAKREAALSAHGPEITIASEPFDVSFEADLTAAQDAIVAHDTAVINLLNEVKTHGERTMATAPQNVADAEARIRVVTDQQTQRSKLEAQRSALASGAAQLQTALFNSSEATAMFTPILERLVADRSLTSTWTHLARGAWEKADALLQFTDANPVSDLPQLTPVPSSVDAAGELIAALVKRQSERSTLKTKCETLRESVAALSRCLLTDEASRTACQPVMQLFAAQPADVPRWISATAAAQKAEAERNAIGETLKGLPAWPASFGNAPESRELAEARLAANAQQIRDRAALVAKTEAARQNTLRLQSTIEKMAERAEFVATQEKLRDTFKGVEKFLQPEHGPRVLMSQTFLRIIDRANEILETIGAEMWLVGNEDFELFAGSPKHGDHLVPVEEEGGGKGYLCGTALALALLESHNETCDRAGLFSLLVDEPTIGVDKSLVPSLMAALTSKGRRANLQTILVEHEPSGEAYCDCVIHID